MRNASPDLCLSAIHLGFYERKGISTMLWDTHMHSQYSGDSDTPQEDMIQTAITKELGGVCFTDHLDIDYPGAPEAFLLDLPNYTSSVYALQEKYRDRLSVRLGIELGLQPHLAALHEDILSQYPFDFVIGSSHVVHGFDVYGHIDYVVRYGPTKNKNYTYEKYKDVIDAILTLLIAKGKGIEINTGGFKYGLGHPNPTEEIIARYRELGGEIITVGADAHKPEHIAFDFEKVPDILKAAGFRYFTVFKERKPEFYPL